MPSGAIPASSPASRPSLLRPCTQQPTSSSSGWSTMPWIAARPTPPVAHWITRYFILFALESRRPLLAASGESFDEIFRDEPDGRVHGLEAQGVVEAAIGEEIDGALGGLNGERRIRRDLRGELVRLRKQDVGGMHLLHQAETVREGCIEAARRECHPLGPRRADLLRQAEVEPAVDRDADLHLRAAEHGALGGEPDVAEHRDLEAGTEAVPVERHDDRLWDRLDALGAAVRAAVALVVVEHLLGRRPPDDPIADIGLEIDPGAERAPGSAEDHRADVTVGGDGFHALRERHPHLPAPRVQAVGPVERDGRDGPVDVEEYGVGRVVWHALLCR